MHHAWMVTGSGLVSKTGRIGQFVSGLMVLIHSLATKMMKENQGGNRLTVVHRVKGPITRYVQCMGRIFNSRKN